jgi:hypothetical protein
VLRTIMLLCAVICCCRSLRLLAWPPSLRTRAGRWSSCWAPHCPLRAAATGSRARRRAPSRSTCTRQTGATAAAGVLRQACLLYGDLQQVWLVLHHTEGCVTVRLMRCCCCCYYKYIKPVLSHGLHRQLCKLDFIFGSPCPSIYAIKTCRDMYAVLCMTGALEVPALTAGRVARCSCPLPSGTCMLRA